MQLSTQSKRPTGILFDSAMGQRPDDPLTLALLYGLDGKNEARVVSISVSKSNLNSAALTETIGRFYSGAVSGAFMSAGRTLPVGMAVSGVLPADTPMLTVTLSKMGAEGKPIYEHGIHKLVDTADAVAVTRNALTSQVDQSVVIVLTGPATNLAQLLDLPGAKALIMAKVKMLVVAVDANWKADAAASRKLFAEWPTAIVAAGEEAEQGLLFPASSFDKDFAWSPAHPVVDAVRAARPGADVPTAGLAAGLYAVRPDSPFFKLSKPGNMSVGGDGALTFSQAADGKVRQLILDAASKASALKEYVELTSAKPVVRAPRFPRNAAAAAKAAADAEAAKAPAAPPKPPLF